MIQSYRKRPQFTALCAKPGCETSEMLEAMGLNEGMDPSTYIAERDEFTSDYDLARIGMSARATPDTTRSNAFCSHLKS